MPHKLIVGDELVLYGDVGDFGDGFDHFSARDVIEALHELGRGDISVRLNSGGGFVSEGTAIFNALKAHRGEVTMYIDGIAASAASVVAMAGDLTVMRPGSLMMIHDPSGLTIGTADEHRGTADVLDKMGNIAASIYAERSGKSAEEIRAMMLAETWLDGNEAAALGFADEVEDAGEAVAYAGFDYTLYQNTPDHILQSAQRTKTRKRPAPPAARTAQPKELIMSKDKPVVAAETQATKTDDNPKVDADYQALLNRLEAAEAKMVAPAPVEPKADEPVAEPRDVTREIMSRCRAAKMTLEQTHEIIEKANGSVDKAKDLLIASLSNGEPPESRETFPHIAAGADAVDRFKEGATRALLARAGMEGGEVNEFTSMKLNELAREHLRLRGTTMNFRTPLEMAGEAFRPYMQAGQHSTSDFVEILANVAGKSMLKGYEDGMETFEAWTSRGVLTDFKPEKRVDLNLFPSLAEVPEGAEYTYGTIGERGESIQLATYGKMFAITRQAVVNDDLNAFTRIPTRMGRAARRTIGNLVYAVLTDNAAMSDGIALFHADHGNLVDTGSGAAPSVITLDAGRAAMATQTDPDGHVTALNIRPRYFLVPVGLEGVASTLMNSEFDPAKTQRTPNHVRSMAEVISDGRLTGTAWYLAADPNQHDTIEVAYLNGNDQPMLEQRDGWNVDGVEFKVRIDAGVKAIDFRGLYKNAGA